MPHVGYTTVGFLLDGTPSLVRFSLTAALAAKPFHGAWRANLCFFTPQHVTERFREDFSSSQFG
jgi:hypothetical protein